MEKVKDEEESLDFFNKLGDDVLDDDIFMAAETFVCKLYGDKNCHSVNSLRNKLFWKHWRNKGKVVDLSLLPPCAPTLRKHTARAHYIAKIWKHANIPMQDIDSFVNYSWLADGNVDWIEVPYPTDVADLFGESTPYNNDDNDDDGDDTTAYDDVEEDDGLGDDSDIEEDE